MKIHSSQLPLLEVDLAKAMLQLVPTNSLIRNQILNL
jgi:hypothetical protein